MPRKHLTREQLLAESEDLHTRLQDAEETLRAIRSGEVDALVVSGVGGEQIFTLEGADYSYRLLIEDMNEGALTLTAEGGILYANRRFAEMLKTPLEKIIGSTIDTWIAPDSQTMLQSLLSKGSVEKRCELALTSGDGEAVQASFSVSDLLTYDRSDLRCVVITDLTEQKRQQAILITAEAKARELLEAANQSRRQLLQVIERQELIEAELDRHRHHLELLVQERTGELASAKDAAETANAAKSTFLSSMSHELRTPLNAILGFAQLLEGSSPAPTPLQMANLQHILHGGWYLLKLINEILDLAVIESGMISLMCEPVPLIDVLSECQAMTESQAQARDIQITVLPFDHTWVANADRTRIKQALINLLTNAIKYNCEHGTVVVECSARTPERLRISIKDSGAGLPPEKLKQLFQPFNRLGQEAGSEEGTGIGLSVTKQLVELMGGTIGVASTVGVGSEFWIELIRDVTTPPLAVGRAQPTERAPPTQGNAAQYTLLYVEDNPANLLLVEQIIENQPHIHMLSARNGELGVSLARAHLPDVILMDINLPGISGSQALRILHDDPATAHIPVIALSANAMVRDIENGMAAGFFRYLTKPIKINEFMDALHAARTVTEPV